MSKTITVGISGPEGAGYPGDVCPGVLCRGSVCVITMMVKLAGLSHQYACFQNLNNDPKQAYRFADTAIVLLVKRWKWPGARSARRRSTNVSGNH